MKRCIRYLLKVLFGFRVENEAALNTPGPVLLIPNHVSWLDWLFVAVCLEDDWRFVTSHLVAQSSWVHRRIMINRRTFPIDATSPYSMKRISEYLQAGGRLVLFAEGRISPTGSLMKFFDGTGFLLHKAHARVVTCYLRGANRLPLVRHTGWTRWFHRVTMHVSQPMTPPHLEHVSASHARQQLTTWLRDRMMTQQFEVEMKLGPSSPLAGVARMAKLRPHDGILQDMSYQTLSYRRIMMGTNLLARQWQSQFGSTPEERVGVLLPNVNAMPVVLLSLWTAGKVPAVLNFSLGTRVMLDCARLAGLTRIITSRAFLDRAHLDISPFLEAGLEVFYLEDVRSRITRSEKIAAWFQQQFRPEAPPKVSLPETAVVLFTSGSEGMPKGVELSHTNLMANIHQMLSVIDLHDHDRVFNALPMFHSFGLTIGTLLPLVRGVFVFVYPSPLHYRLVPVAVYDRQCTVMLGTNTFLNGYARKAHPYDFRSLRYLFAGAEKVQEPTSTTWARRFGVRILEGYGATECGPCISVNTPMEPKHGTAGRLLPGMDYRLEPVEGVHDGGRLFVKGPNIMRGYLNADANSEFQAAQGWYDTGDIARVDEEGYVEILGRLKRFAKVSGEMISLTAVEEALAGAFPHYGLRCQVAVISRPDDHKGEALVAVSNEPRLTVEEIRSAIKARGMSNLCVPREILVVREIPKLGTGKIDHRELQRQLFQAEVTPSPVSQSSLQ